MSLFAIFSSQVWLIIGFTGQALFTARFLVQWLVSEKKRNSVVPEAFWWLSLFGGATLLVYATYRQDPVIMVGQGMGLVVYVRNLMLVSKAKRHGEKGRRRNPDEMNVEVGSKSVVVTGTRPHARGASRPKHV